MSKIKGKFAPLFSELGEDPRWLMECNDQQKFLFILVLMTVYECNNSAPDDPHYYKVRYNLRHRLGRVEADLRHLKVRFPKLLSQNKKLSLNNYRGYKNRVDEFLPKKENKNKKENKKTIFLTESFSGFYLKYPNKKNRGVAEKAWNKLNPSPELVEEIMAGLGKAINSKDWKKDDGEYIPYPSTFINGRRWEDEWEPEKTKPIPRTVCNL